MTYVYTLDAEHALVPAVDLHEYFVWLDAERARLGQDLPVASLQVRHEQVNGHTLSTVFLGMDHNYGDGPPLVFETMYFDGDDEQWRWHTWDEAVAGHEAIKAAILDGTERH